MPLENTISYIRINNPVDADAEPFPTLPPMSEGLRPILAQYKDIACYYITHTPFVWGDGLCTHVLYVLFFYMGQFYFQVVKFCLLALAFVSLLFCLAIAGLYVYLIHPFLHLLHFLRKRFLLRQFLRIVFRVSLALIGVYVERFLSNPPLFIGGFALWVFTYFSSYYGWVWTVVTFLIELYSPFQLLWALFEYECDNSPFFPEPEGPYEPNEIKIE